MRDFSPPTEASEGQQKACGRAPCPGATLSCEGRTQEGSSQAFPGASSAAVEGQPLPSAGGSLSSRTPTETVSLCSSKFHIQFQVTDIKIFSQFLISSPDI